jgi:DNA-directed RNA polymerase subunit M
VKFCQRCGTRLIQMLSQPHTLTCPKCGYKTASITEDDPSAHVTRPIRDEKIVVIGEKTEFLVQPNVRAKCPKCSGNRAYCRTIEADEEVEVQVFKCTQCGHTWREKR